MGKLGKFTDETFKVALHTCRLHDARGTWNHLELRVFDTESQSVIWRKWEYNTVTLNEVKIYVAERLSLSLQEWITELRQREAVEC